MTEGSPGGPSSWPRVRPAMAALVILLGGACGGGAGAPAITNATVVEVASGKETTVRSVAATETPTLFWFWAPH